MEKLVIIFFFLIVNLLAKDVDSSYIKYNLPYNSTYQSAVIDSKYEVKFDKAGNLVEGVLLENYEKDGLVFKAGTKIKFYQNGNILNGVLFENYEKDGLVFNEGSLLEFRTTGEILKGNIKNGSYSYNLKLKGSATASFYLDGTITSLSTVGSNKYNILNHNLINRSELYFDYINKRYYLKSGTFADSQIIGKLQTNNYNDIIPLVIPKGTKFTFSKFSNSIYDMLFINDFNFTINNYKIGKCQIQVKDKKLIFIIFYTTVILDGITFKLNDFAKFDKDGKIYKIVK